MIKDYSCETCNKSAVCKIKDILDKFSEDAKKDLGVNITMDSCINFKDEADDEDSD